MRVASASARICYETRIPTNRAWIREDKRPCGGALNERVSHYCVFSNHFVVRIEARAQSATAQQHQPKPTDQPTNQHITSHALAPQLTHTRTLRFNYSAAPLPARWPTHNSAVHKMRTRTHTRRNCSSLRHTTHTCVMMKRVVWCW